MRDLVTSGHAAAQTATTASIGLDAYGSAITTTGTNLARSSSYTPFGTPTGTNTFDLRLGYRGEIQSDTLIHLRARQYEPARGAFTSVDPLDGVAGTTTIANSYHYADNNPLHGMDPLGLQTSDTNLWTQPGTTNQLEPGGPCSWEVAVLDVFVNPDHDPGTPDRPRCRTELDDYLDILVSRPETWEIRDGYRECQSVWTISVRVVDKMHAGQRYGVLVVEPSGAARGLARFSLGSGWIDTWRCAKYAIGEIDDQFTYGTENSYHSQYECHANGVGVPVPGGRWQGGPTWDLEGWRDASWNPFTWVSAKCNW